MKKLILSAVIAVGVFGSAPAMAAGYGDAGCGLGSIVFGSKPGFVQLFAATTNGTFASQTLGITFGTSNCQGGVLSAASTRAYIETNQVALLKDISRGSGETVRSLAAVAGCGSHEAVGSMLQSRFGVLAAEGKTDGLADRVINSLATDDSLQCKFLRG